MDALWIIGLCFVIFSAFFVAFVALTFVGVGAYCVYKWAKTGYETEMLERSLDASYFINPKPGMNVYRGPNQ